MRAKKRKVLTEVTLMRHVRSTNRNFYYYCSLIYFRSPEQAAAGFRLNYREPVIKRSFFLFLSLPIWLIEDYRRKIRTAKYDPTVFFLNVLATKYSLRILFQIRRKSIFSFNVNIHNTNTYFILNSVLIFIECYPQM